MYNIPSALFKHEYHIPHLHNNTNELIGCYQQGKILLSVRGEYYKLVSLMASDPSGLAQ